MYADDDRERSDEHAGSQQILGLSRAMSVGEDRVSHSCSFRSGCGPSRALRGVSRAICKLALCPAARSATAFFGRSGVGLCPTDFSESGSEFGLSHAQYGKQQSLSSRFSARASADTIRGIARFVSISTSNTEAHFEYLYETTRGLRFRCCCTSAVAGVSTSTFIALTLCGFLYLL